MTLAICLGVIAAFAALAGHKTIARAARAFGWSPKRPTLVLIDVDSGTPIGDLITMAAALQSQIDEDFAPIWGLSAVVRAATPAAPWLAGESRIEFRRAPSPEDEGALAVHDVDEHGVPLARVFPYLCRLSGEQPSVATSHELLELLGDPLLRDCVQLPDGRIAAKELCDQVQAQSYDKGGTLVSNFVTPQNFSPSKDGGERYDFLGNLSAAFEVADGGYAQVYEPHKGWTQLGESQGYRALLKALKVPTRATRRAQIGMLS